METLTRRSFYVAEDPRRRTDGSQSGIIRPPSKPKYFDGRWALAAGAGYADELIQRPADDDRIAAAAETPRALVPRPTSA